MPSSHRRLRVRAPLLVMRFVASTLLLVAKSCKGFTRYPSNPFQSNSWKYISCRDASTDETNVGTTDISCGTIIYAPPAVPLKGDFVGYLATFTLKGELIDVPEHFVPDDLLEWGQGPSSLEIITSEDDLLNTNNSDETEWKRQTITVYPAVGCSVDNLDTTTKEESIPSANIFINESETARALHYVSQPNGKVRFEVTFGRGGREADDERIKISTQASPQLDSLAPPVEISIERRFQETSSHGKRAQGGGLDGRSISTWMGGDLRRLASFAEDLPKAIANKEPDTIAANVPFEVFPGNVTVGQNFESNTLLVEIGCFLGCNARHLVRWAVREDKVETPEFCVEMLND